MSNILEQYFNLVKRFIPAKTEGSSVGLDIGNADCKFVQIQKKGNAFELLNWGIEPVVQDNVEASLRKVLDRFESPYADVCTAVAGRGTLIRYISMPRMSVDDLRNSFAIEADKYFPFAQEQIYTDCFILDPQGKDKSMSVMAAAVKKELVDQRVQLLTRLGIQTDFIGINPVALANGVHVLGTGVAGPEEPVMALFDMGESVSNLTIMVDKLPRFTRDIFIGGRDYTKMISNVLGVNAQEAEKLKRHPADKSEQIVNACEPAVMNMVQEIKLSFDYFTTERNHEIKRMLLTGGGSMLNGIEAVLAKAFDIKVDRWDPLGFLQLSPALSTDEELRQQSIRLGVAVGLALYRYDRN
ncbi:MAG: type IV pilus assembly protein PilM [Candidatus Omnitrophica bacterium]|nr:type IV pilus assembly protein PilM [Candidatus Omnitrophota bacterium]